ASERSRIGWKGKTRADSRSSDIGRSKAITALADFSIGGDRRAEKRDAMKKKRTTWLAILSLVGAGCLAAQTTQAAANPQAVRAAAAQFYVALQVLFTGDMGPMTQVWSHADDVTYMGPGGGFDVGWQKVGANW